jgi:hypothetical protein
MDAALVSVYNSTLTPMLQLEVFDTAGRRTIAVEHLPFSIGRSSDNQLQLSDAQVSRRHAEVTSHDGGWRIRDCGSRFGTYLNDQPVKEDTPFGPGDRVRIGQTEFRILDGQSSVLASGTFDFHQMNALLAGLRALGSSGVLDEVLAIVIDSALEVTGAERGFICWPQHRPARRLSPVDEAASPAECKPAAAFPTKSSPAKIAS